MTDKDKQRSDIVRYENTFNEIVFNNLSKTEYNILFAISIKVRNKGNQVVTISLDELKKMTKFSRKDKNIQVFLESLLNKLGSIAFISHTPDKSIMERRPLFLMVRYNLDANTFSVQVNPPFVNLFNDFNHYTTFSFADYLDLKGIYSKTLYRLLKQFNSSGKRYFS